MRISILMTCLAYQLTAVANMRCVWQDSLPQTQTHTLTWTWSDQQLSCFSVHEEINPITLNSYAMDDLWVIRGHQSKLEKDHYQVLAQTHGYHLVLTLSEQLETLDDGHNHLDFMPLSAFNGINKARVNRAIAGTPAVADLVNQVDAVRWRDDVTTLSAWSRRTGESGNVAAANWIAAKLNTLGYQTSFQPFNVGPTPSNNIIGIQPGTTRPNDWYLVGGHMDSVPAGNAPGAVDNASGCAATLEMALIASQYQFEGTLIFMCFSGEEQGLFGSEFHADSLISNGDDDKIKLALTLDMVGYTSNSDHELLLESSSTYLPLMNEMAQYAATYVPDLDVYTSTNYFGSDHVSYIDNGMPGILSIDDDWNVYPGYHQSTDLPENINLTQGEYIIKTNMATLADKAGIVGLSDVIFADDFE